MEIGQIVWLEFILKAALLTGRSGIQPYNNTINMGEINVWVNRLVDMITDGSASPSMYILD